jgi:hypothetical protein
MRASIDGDEGEQDWMMKKLRMRTEGEHKTGWGQVRIIMNSMTAWDSGQGGYRYSWKAQEQKKKQGQWRTRTVGGTRTRGERRTRTEQDKGHEEKNDGRRTKKGREQENPEDRYKMRTMVQNEDHGRR